MVEMQNTWGTYFRLYDHTDVVIPDQASYLYHFENKGGSGLLRNYVDCHHLTEAIVAAPSYNEAVSFLTAEELGVHAAEYTFDVNLIAVDLMTEEGIRFITKSHKRPLA